MEKPKILIVDDNPHIAKLISMHLHSDYDISHAEDGEEGLNKAVEISPNIIITDVSMPKMDGLQMCLALRAKDETAMTPFIFLTSFDADVTRKKGFRQGADQYLIKSEIQPETLQTKVGELMKRVHKIHNIKSGAEIKGELSEISFIEIIHLLNRLKKTGTLLLVRQNYPEAKIYFDAGEMLSGELGSDSGMKVMQSLSGWKRGGFEFKAGPVNAIKTISLPTLDLVLDSFR